MSGAGCNGAECHSRTGNVQLERAGMNAVQSVTADVAQE